MNLRKSIDSIILDSCTIILTFFKFSKLKLLTISKCIYLFYKNYFPYLNIIIYILSSHIRIGIDNPFHFTYFIEFNLFISFHMKNNYDHFF